MLSKPNAIKLAIILLTIISISALISPISSATARSARSVQQSGELLTNPNFEQPYIQLGTADIFVANGWQAWYVTPDGVNYPIDCTDKSPDNCKAYRIPGYRNTQPQNEKEPARARSGDSQSWGVSYAVYVAGVYQHVANLTPGTRVRFSAYLQGFNCDDDRGCFGGVGKYGYSYEPGDMRTRVGIDPTGGTDAFSPSVVWSAYANPLDAFAQQQVEATAQGNAVTVFVWSWPTYPEKHTQVYLDDASLVSIGQGTVVPNNPTQPAGTAQPIGTAGPIATIVPGSNTYTVQAGDGLFAIALANNLTLDQLLALNPGLTRDSILQIGQVINIGGNPPATPLPTSAPTTEPTSEPTAEATGAATSEPTAAASTPAATETTPEPTTTPGVAASGLCLIAFDDVNQSGDRDNGEALVSGVQFEVKDAAGTSIATYTSDGQNEPHCLDKLPDGRYSVDVQLPADRQATTEIHWSLSLLSGTSVNVKIGSQLAPTETATPEITAIPTAAASASSTSGGSSFGLIVGAALVVLAGIALFIGLRSRQKPA